ncbi:MAG: hypothetical protein AAGJ10_17340 [Bacteroidota bacterium]
MATSVQPLCLACQHLDRQQLQEPVCAAFSEGIPEDIWLNRRAHFSAIPGDDGLQFELAVIDPSMLN